MVNKITGSLDGWLLPGALPAVLIYLLLFSACSSTTAVVEQEGEKLESTMAGQQQEMKTAPWLKEKWGIEITSLAMTAGGHMVDFRFRVLDSTKAATLFAPENKPYLIDQASQKVFSVPVMAKVGPLRTAEPPKQDRIYWMFFGTVPGEVKTGSKVTVVIGDFRVENMVVQ